MSIGGLMVSKTKFQFSGPRLYPWRNINLLFDSDVVNLH